MRIFNAKSADEKNSHGKYLNDFFSPEKPMVFGNCLWGTTHKEFMQED